MPYFLPLGPDEKVCLTQMKGAEMFHQTSHIPYSTFLNTSLSEQTIDSWRIPNLECGCAQEHHLQERLATLIVLSVHSNSEILLSTSQNARKKPVYL